MKALVSTPDGAQPAEIREVEEPAPAPDELVVDVRAVSLNRGELSLLPARPGWRPGQDIAGVVAQAAPDGSGPESGSRVAAVVDGAGWAERVAAPVSRVGLLPDTVPFGAGACLGVAGLTALRALRVGGSLFGARVLVTGAAGGVGTFAVQLAHLGGAEVTAVAASRERGEPSLALGAQHAMLDGEDPGGPFDLVMEGVGGPSLERSLHALAPGGLIVLYGSAAGQPARIGLPDFRGAAGGRIQGFFIYQTGTDTFGRDLTYLARLTGEGRLRPQIGLELGWRELGAAMEALRNRKVNGKVVLSID
ncbi:MAG: zinc-binding dehydrogenase [Chloroflexi bacterium]|nr:zinc-binding dehydrogenase [Chloroflexota bacterium]